MPEPDWETVRNYAMLGVVVLALAGVGYFLWSRAAPPEPTLAPGQSLKYPFGTGQAAGPAGQVQATPQAGAGHQVPAPGTVDPKLGFGPSPGGPFRPQQRPEGR